jgi:hypothetical protein
MIDVETSRILGLEVTDEAVQDEQMFLPLLDQIQRHCGEEHPVHLVLGDWAYDLNNPFETLEHRGSSPASRPGRMPRSIPPGHPIGPNA